MMQVSIYKLSLTILLILISELFLLCTISYASNATYVTLSAQIAKQNQLDVVANNVANINTVGFEQDVIMLRSVAVKQNSKRKNNFVWSETTYRSGDSGPLKITNRPTDLAIVGNGYFKVATPKGERYTLDGSMLISNQGVLVNSSGFPYLGSGGEFIEIAEDFESIEVTQDGTVFVDLEEIGIIGVFGFITTDPIIKEGGNLYAIAGQSVVLEEFTIVSGALRASNVNSTLAMTQMVEMQRAFGLTTDLMSNINETETSAINKLTK